jgi:NAD-dependent SIR2 family protein deacetylase
MDDVECPYCAKYFDVDYCEREQGETFEYSCPHCEKMVFITLDFMPTFDIEKAPCLNGGEHDWYEISSSFHGKYKKCNCGATEGKMSDKEAFAKMEKDQKEWEESRNKEEINNEK